MRINDFSVLKEQLPILFWNYYIFHVIEGKNL